MSAPKRVKLDASAKRTRDPNLTDENIKQFLDTMGKYATIIESKSAAFGVSERKLKAWGEVKRQFHAKSGVNKDLEQLKQLWRRLKNKARKDIAAWRRVVTKTGGGTAEVEEPDTDAFRIKDMAPKDFEAQTNEYDGDAYPSDPEQQDLGEPASVSVTSDNQASDCELPAPESDVVEDAPLAASSSRDSPSAPPVKARTLGKIADHLCSCISVACVLSIVLRLLALSYSNVRVNWGHWVVLIPGNVVQHRSCNDSCMDDFCAPHGDDTTKLATSEGHQDRKKKIRPHFGGLTLA